MMIYHILTQGLTSARLSYKRSDSRGARVAQSDAMNMYIIVDTEIPVLYSAERAVYIIVDIYIHELNAWSGRVLAVLAWQAAAPGHGVRRDEAHPRPPI